MVQIRELAGRDLGDVGQRGPYQMGDLGFLAGGGQVAALLDFVLE